MRPLCFVDLDDTLFQTRRKCDNLGELWPAAFLRDGSPHSFMDSRQRWLFESLLANATVIPTTARNSEAFSRVRLPFVGPAVLDHGGVIVEGNRPDGAWHALMAPNCAAAADPLRELTSRMRAFRHDVRAWVVEDFGLPFYAVAKHSDADEVILDRLFTDCVQGFLATHHGFREYRSGNNLAVLPEFLDKAHAVRHLIDCWRARGDDLVTWAIGDSRSDARFIALCDFAIVPRGTQLHSDVFAVL